MPRGGKRQGTPGKGYSNRTDLATNVASQTADTTAATGGYQAPRLAARRPEPAPLTPEDTPFPTDPTAYPSESLMAEPTFSLPDQAAPDVLLIRSLMAVSPNPDLRRLLARLESR